MQGRRHQMDKNPIYLGAGVQPVQAEIIPAVGAAPNEPEWAGNLVAHRLVQHEDGTLTLGEVKGINEKI